MAGTGDQRFSPGARGREVEDAACRYLAAQGMRLLERNYRCKCGEIDLVMQDKETIVFVEVRYRRSIRYGDGAESVDYRKRRKLVMTALHYLQSRRLADRRPARFDVVAVTAQGNDDHIRWISDAFQA